MFFDFFVLQPRFYSSVSKLIIIIISQFTLISITRYQVIGSKVWLILADDTNIYKVPIWCRQYPLLHPHDNLWGGCVLYFPLQMRDSVPREALPSDHTESYESKIRTWEV